MKNTNQNIKFTNTKETQKINLESKDGILIYKEAQVKLHISNNGKLYRQNFTSFIPLIGPLFSSVYANLCIGKIKCLKTEDARKFSVVSKMINLFSFFLWPIIFLGIWTLIQFLIMDFAGPAVADNFVKMWDNYINQISLQIQTNDTPLSISYIFNGLFQIFVNPLLTTFGMVSNLGLAPFAISFSDTVAIPANIIFIASIFILTWINPVNIFNSILLNKKSCRFTIVLENEAPATKTKKEK